MEDFKIKVNQNAKQLKEKAAEAQKKLEKAGVDIRRVTRGVRVKGVEISFKGLLQTILIFIPMTLGFASLGNTLPAQVIAIIVYLIPIVISSIQIIRGVVRTYRECRSDGASKLLRFRNLLLLLQMITILILASHLIYIGSENRAKKLRSYSLMISVACLSQLPETLSRFSIESDDLHKILIPLLASALLLIMTLLTRNNDTTGAAYTVMCALLSAVVILSDSIGKKISSEPRDLELLPAFASLFLALIALYVCVSVKGFPILWISKETQSY